jgi:hypothetical protein
MVIKSYRGKLQESDVWAIDKALRIKTVFQDYLEDRYGQSFFVEHEQCSSLTIYRTDTYVFLFDPS